MPRQHQLTSSIPPPRVPQERWARLLEGARLRRALVYVIAAVLIIYAGATAVRLALPPDPHGPVRVESLPGYSGASGGGPTKVTYDAQTGHTFLETTDANGASRRYRVEKETGGWQVYEARE